MPSNRANQKVRLNEANVRSLRPQSERYIVWDEDCTGFGVRILPSGTKAFIMNERLPNGRMKQETLGRFPTLSVMAARNQAIELKGKMRQGFDPIAERRRKRQAGHSIEDLWKFYEANHLPTLADRSRDDQRAMWSQLILPYFKSRLVSEITRSEVVQLHAHVTEHRGSTRANRVYEVLRKAFNLVIDETPPWRLDNPATRLKRNPEVQREAMLDLEEAQRLVEVLNNEQDRVLALCLLFIIFSGCRPGEAYAAKWDQFDPELRLWTQPAEANKQRKVHRKPLIPQATQVLQEVQQLTNGTYVFPSSSRDVPRLPPRLLWGRITREAGLSGKRINDLRHTFASLSARELSLLELKDFMGHGSIATTQRYAHLYEEDRQSKVARLGKQFPDLKPED